MVDVWVVIGFEPNFQWNVRESLLRIDLRVILKDIYEILILILTQRNVFWIAAYDSHRVRIPLRFKELCVNYGYIQGSP